MGHYRPSKSRLTTGRLSSKGKKGIEHPPIAFRGWLSGKWNSKDVDIGKAFNEVRATAKAVLRHVRHSASDHFVLSLGKHGQVWPWPRVSRQEAGRSVGKMQTAAA